MAPLGADAGGIPYKNYSEQRRMREELEDVRYRMRNMEERRTRGQGDNREPRKPPPARATNERNAPNAPID